MNKKEKWIIIKKTKKKTTTNNYIDLPLVRFFSGSRIKLLKVFIFFDMALKITQDLLVKPNFEPFQEDEITRRIQVGTKEKKKEDFFTSLDLSIM